MLYTLDRFVFRFYVAAMIFVLVILSAVVTVFADTTATVISNAPWWVNALLAFAGAGALGGGGVWAWLGNIIGQKNRSIQFLRNFVNDLCLLFVEIRVDIITNPAHVARWNKVFQDGADGMKMIKFLADKAPLIEHLKIEYQSTPSPVIEVTGSGTIAPAAKPVDPAASNNVQVG
jgi:hypothetical protein